ncbi:hypothetical protein AJ87_42865 [Rhizobium yanglingense]|nr:hypothetical protein AJ87_42865 [Rhizobium yanglingense]
MYDLIIIDAPNLEDEEGAVWLAAHVDSIVVVVAAGRTTERRLVNALNRLSVNQPFILGGVLNQAAISKGGKVALANSGLWTQVKARFRQKITA